MKLCELRCIIHCRHIIANTPRLLAEMKGGQITYCTYFTFTDNPTQTHTITKFHCYPLKSIMTDHDSASESDTRKQPPLSQEEVTILESYIEQWDSAEPSERKRVSKAAATEARTKAPVMSIRLLKDRKVVSLSSSSSSSPSSSS